MPLEITFSGTIDNRTYKEARATLYGGKPLQDPPKSHIKVGSIYHNIGNSYNPHHADIYMDNTRNRQLYYSIYRDGYFYPCYGRFFIY